MPAKPITSLSIRYTLKQGTRDAMLAEIRVILDLCAQEPEFITAILQETPARPDELQLFELWRGTREDFQHIQGPKPYRQQYLARSKHYYEQVEAIFSTPVSEWGTDLLDR